MMMRFKSKRNMTLMEVLIASFLAMILLTIATKSYRQVVLLGKESEKIEEEQFKMAYLEKRLFSCLPKTISSRTKQRDFYFFTTHAPPGETTLIFTYDKGVDAEAKNSNHVIGRLFLDSQKLILATWHSPKKWENQHPPVKKEILLDNVSSLNFEFYVPPKKDRSLIVTKIHEILPENSWHKTWRASYNQLPALVKILITRKINNKETTLTFAFSLPNTDFQIVYEK